MRFAAPFLLLVLAIAGSSAAQPGGAFEVPLTVRNRETASKKAEPVTSGVPFAQGVLSDTSKLRLLQGNAEVPSQFRTLARWPDGSIRWLLLDFQVDLPASGAAALALRTGAAPAPVTGIDVNDLPGTLTVSTGAATFAFNKNELVIGGITLQVNAAGTGFRAVPIAHGWTVEESGSMKTVVRVEGTWRSGTSALGNGLVGFRARLFFYKGKDGVRVQLTFRNDNSFGWDGDKGQDITLSGAGFGIPLLAAGGEYVFGQGAEKTWELEVPAHGSPANLETRHDASGKVARGYAAPRPLAVAAPAYYASTQAFGPIALPAAGLPSSIQADVDLFEKLQRAKVVPADLTDTPGMPGITLWAHLAQDIGSWNDYGDIRWGGDCGPFSGNHYDWTYGMLLQFMRTGLYPFIDAARILSRHEIDFDIYHTGADGSAFNYQKNWETRPSHDSPDNCFGGGRPSHTWLQGSALCWLLTGDPRARDAVDELTEGVRGYVYDSFNENGYIGTNEIRIQGWLVENLVTVWRLDPKTVFQTTRYGPKTVPQAIKDVLESVFDQERAAGGKGYILDGDPAQANLSAPLQHCYFIEPAIKAYLEVFKGRDAAYAPGLLGLIKRITSWLISTTYGGDTNPAGLYRPRQIPYLVDRNLPARTEGQIPYLLMAANAAGFCFLETGEGRYRDYMVPAFQDYIRYVGVEAGDTYLDPSRRTATSFNSSVYVDTESKIHGWSNRYGQFFLAAEEAAAGR